MIKDQLIDVGKPPPAGQLHLIAARLIGKATRVPLTWRSGQGCSEHLHKPRMSTRIHWGITEFLSTGSQQCGWYCPGLFLISQYTAAHSLNKCYFMRKWKKKVLNERVEAEVCYFIFFFFFTCKGSILLLHGDVRSLVLHHTCAAFTSHVSHLHSHENTEVIVLQKEQSRLTGLNRFFSASQHISECSELSAYLYVCMCVLIALVVPHCNAPMQRNENSSAGVTAPGRPQESNREVLSL